MSQRPSKNPFLDPVIVAQLGNLRLRARRILDGFYSGHHANRTFGQSHDFSEHRPYNPGDDLRRLDWKVWGRTDRLVIKRFEEQTSVAAFLVLDNSASMKYAAEGRLTKWEYAQTLAAGLSYLVVAQNDAIGLISRRLQLAPSSNQNRLESLFEALQGLKPEGVFDFSTLPEMLAGFVKKRAFVMVFSDLLENSSAVISALRSLHARRHEVLVFHIFDPAERDLPFEGPILFRDLETGETIKTDASSLRASYQQLVRKKISQFAHIFQSSGLDYLFLTTDTPFDKGLGAYLSWREAQF